jgi:pimeloyl-ACP methyl ester carboxylesterase
MPTRHAWVRRAAALLAAAAACSAGGCGEFYARQLVEPKPGRGTVVMGFYPPGGQMRKDQRISRHLVCHRPDGAAIDVWVLNARDPNGRPVDANGTMLILHHLDECKGSFLYMSTAERLAAMGYDAVLPDLRAHGRSSGKFVTYGAKEKHDLKAVMDELVGHGSVDPNVYVFGENRAASIAIQYAAVDPRCKGVMACAPYTDFRGYARFQHWAMSEKDFEKTVADAAALADFDPDEASALAAAGKLTCPLLILHGLLDVTAPRAHAEAIYNAAAGPKKMLTPGPEHVLRAGILPLWIAEQMDALATRGVGD